MEKKFIALVAKLAVLLKEPRLSEEKWRGFFFLHVQELADLMNCDLVPRRKSEYQAAPVKQPMSQVDMAKALKDALGGKKRK